MTILSPSALVFLLFIGVPILKITERESTDDRSWRGRIVKKEGEAGEWEEEV